MLKEQIKEEAGDQQQRYNYGKKEQSAAKTAWLKMLLITNCNNKIVFNMPE